MINYYVKIGNKIYLVNDINVARMSANYYVFEDSEMEYSEAEYGEIVNGEYKVIERVYRDDN